jgi:two-component system cell cycle sensor histidine kinase/response regulator CckA
MSRDTPEYPDNLRPDGDILRESLRLAAVGVATPGAGNVFRELVRHLAVALDVDHAFIGVLEPGSTDTVRVISGYFFRQFDDDFTYDLKDTPCENVIGQQFRFYAEGVQRLFADPHVKELQTEGYAGIPLYDSRGGVLGIMSIAHRKPLHDPALIEDLLKIFSVRAAVELERRYADQARSEKEQELRKSEDRLRATVEAAIDCIVAMDSKGRVIEFNPAAEQCFGYRRNDILGEPLAERIIPARFRAGHESGMARFRATGRGDYLGKRVEVTALRADGSEFPAELAIDVAQGEEGEIFIGYIRDITERHEAEEQRQRLEGQLRQAQKMEAIGQLTGGIAHDFNNILTAMLGYMVLAEEQAETLADDRLVRYLDRSQRAGQRARDLIQQMLTFSRGQHGEPRPVALAPLIREWIGLLGTTLPSSIEIRTDLDPEAPEAMADPVQLEQVLMNLCINARDAMQGHGTLTMSLCRVTHGDCVCASCRQPVAGEFVEIAVSDTGPGVPVEVQERMFEPFYSTKEVGHGSGMGLPMVHGIIHEHGGHLLLDSRPGVGTALRILLPPLAAVDAVKTPTDSGEARMDARLLDGRVLLVDDEPAVSEFMQDLLQDWGMVVEVQNSSVDACTSFSEDPDHYDLVILDQTMPRMTGMEVAEQLLKLRPDLPVLLYTGYSNEVNAEQVSQAGIRALINKPVDTARLHELIRQVLSPRASSS